MRGVAVWLSLLVLTLECCAASTRGVGADASTHDVLPVMDAADAPTVVDVVAPVDANPLAAPRPIAPLSTATVTAQNPTLHWSLAPGGLGAHVQVCHDRACTAVEQTFDATGSQATIPISLAPGVHFWRLASRDYSGDGATWSPTWEFIVGHRSAPVDTSFGTVPDFNGDGFADVVVGGNEDAFAYLGAASGLDTSPIVLARPVAGDGGNLAICASAGDVNGDGIADLIVGWGHSASLYLGRADGFGIGAATTLRGPPVDLFFGISVSSAGDVNGDGYADVIIGGAQHSSSGPFEAYVYLGGGSGLDISPITLTQRVGSVSSTAWVAGAGDVNGDGFGDFIVGSPGLTGNSLAYIYLGGRAWIMSAPILLASPYGLVGFGNTVAGAGDINGDGYADVVVTSASGFLSVFLGTVNGVSLTPMVRTVGPREYPLAVGAGDVNGDSYDDIAVSSPDGTFVFLGGTNGPSNYGWMVADGPHAIAGAGDINGDGYDELIAGNWMDGTASIFFGAASFPLAVPVILRNAADPSFGNGVASARPPVATTKCHRAYRLRPPPFEMTIPLRAG